MSFFCLDVSITIDIEFIPGLIEISFYVARNLGSLQLMSCLENDTSCLRSSLFEKNFFTVLDSIVVFSFAWIFWENFVHNIIFVGTVEIWDFLSHLYLDSLDPIRSIVSRESQKRYNNKELSEFHVYVYANYNKWDANMI